MSVFFVTGTDTDVGKSVVCGLLGRYIINKDRSVITQKWIQTGCEDFPEDIAMHLSLMDRQKKDIEKYLPYIAPYNLRFAGSAHLAAAMEKKKIDAEKIKDSFTKLSKKFDTVIVEGIGGALVPFNKKYLVVDIAAELKLPVIIVIKNKLGAINHTLLTVEALRARNMKIIGLVFNSQKEEDKTIAEDNPEIIKILTGEKILGQLPWQKNRKLLQKAFENIGNNIINISGEVRQ